MTNKVLSMIVAMLFFAVVVISVFGTTWSMVDELPENAADQSNIEGIGVLLFTDFVVPFEVLSLVLLATLIGATFMAKSEVKE
jgi:NADH:ubiquinone oxidoreductase subunit 6 (subunit J)